jgi:hypothetical protein
MKLRLAAIAAVITSGCAFASPVGTLGIGSTGVVDATLTSLFWTVDPAAIGTCPVATCNGDVNTGTTLTFLGGPLATQEGILINGGVPFGTPPPAGATIFNPFLQFADHPNLLYTLTAVAPGSSNQDCTSLTNLQVCSLDVAGTPSPVVLQLSNGGTLVSIGFLGTVTDGNGTSTWSGNFSATIPNMTPADILNFFCGADNVCSAADVAAGKSLVVPSVSGSFQATATPSTVPEPGTISMLLGGAGLMGIGLLRRKRRGSAQIL